MPVTTGQAVTVTFTTRDPDTGSAADASDPPEGVLLLNGTDNGATVSVTNVGTGRYKAAVTLPTLADADVVELLITATVGSVTDSSVIWRDSRDTLTAAKAPQLFGVTRVVSAPWATDATTSGTALRAAVEAALSGTLILVEPGQFYVGTSALVYPAGVHVRGLNREATIIVSGSGTGVTSFVLGNLGTLENLTLYNNSSGHVLGLTGTQTVSNALVRNARLLGQADLLHVTSSVASAMTLENVIARGTSIGSGILSSGAAHEYRLTDVQVLLFGPNAVAGINLAGAANVRGERVKVELPDASGGLALKVAGTSQARLSDVRLKAATANVNIVDGTAGVTLIGGEFDRSLVTGVAASLTDVFSPLRPSTVGRTLDVGTDGEIPVVTDVTNGVTADNDAIVDGILAGIGEIGGGTGDGDVPVNHDYGGTDELRVTQAGTGVDNAAVRAYLTADYDAGTFTVRGLTYTGSDGRFVAPLMLDADDYTLVVSKSGVIQTKAVEITVA